MASRASLPPADPEVIEIAKALARMNAARDIAALVGKDRPGADRHLRSVQQPASE